MFLCVIDPDARFPVVLHLAQDWPYRR